MRLFASVLPPWAWLSLTIFYSIMLGLLIVGITFAIIAR